MTAYDVVIAGGGLAGLSLAAHLAPTGGVRILVVDDGRPAPRAWGYWSTGDGLLDRCAHTWYGNVRLYAAGRARFLPVTPYRYRVARRTDLSRLVHRYPSIEWRAGTVEHVGDDGTVTVDGRAVRGTWVFDSVTRSGGGAPADARLAFTGWEIRCTRPVFDPAAPVLFDFRTAQGDGARFVYVRPEDPYRALVELTAFVPRHAQPPTPAERNAALTGYLADVLHAGAVEVLGVESAVLPLRTAAVRRTRGRVLAIGSAAGMVKASTGFAYQRIQRDSAAIARSLAGYGDPFHLPPPRHRYRLLDAVLLDVLDRDPAQLEHAFAQLFTALPADRVLRFLDEDAPGGDILRVMNALPPGPYLAALAHRIGGSGDPDPRDRQEAPPCEPATSSGTPPDWPSAPRW